MDRSPHDRLHKLGLQLPPVSPPKGSYVPAVRAGDLIYVSGQVPMINGELITTGIVGREISLERAHELAGSCALAALAALDSIAGLENIERIVKVTGFVASDVDFTDHPMVVDGASDLLVAILGDEGRHARSAVGVAQLPLGAPVEIEVIAALKLG